MDSLFRQLIRDAVASPVRAAGFKRRDLTFTRVAGAYTHVLNVQRSSFNDRALCSFTFNTGVYVPSVVQAYYQQHAPVHPTESVCILRRRGGFLATGRDLWFELTPETDFTATSSAVRVHVSSVLLPYLNSLQNPEALRKALETPPADPQQQVFRALFYLLEGPHERGASLLLAQIRAASNPVYRSSLLGLAKRLSVADATH